MSTDSHQAPGSISPRDCWDVLERAAHSRALKRAARLREFLLYVGAQSLHEGRIDLHEQEIGETVFGRPPAYDTSQDNIVRVSATELRKRVDAYFASEGEDELLIFEIPRGSYMPTFRLRESRALPLEPIAAAEATPPEAPEIPSSQPPPRRNLLAMLFVIATVLAIACALLWWQNRSLREKMQDCHCTTTSS